MKRMFNKRVIVWTLLLFAGGAVGNVAVAWGCVVAADYPEIGILFRGEPMDASEMAPYLDESGADRVRGWQEWAAQGRDAAWTSYDFGAVCMTCDVGSGFSQPYIAIAAGCPFSSMSGWRSWVLVGNGQTLQERETARQNLRKSNLGAVGVHEFPLLPLWPGFAINTIFYAAILWLLCITPGFIRRKVRIRCGNCPACGYHIAPGTSEVCSECGAPLPASLTPIP